MKKSILVLAVAAIGMVSFTSCSNDSGNEPTAEGQVEKEYYCPMKCEGEKMYAEEGSCPVCEMNLVKD
jgi:hypothetical protein